MDKDQLVALDRAATYYIDCEFDGHNGPLLSMALVREDGHSIHIQTIAKANDPWVRKNVVPYMDAHMASAICRVQPNAVGDEIRWFLDDCRMPHIIADSPVDIGRFCQALSTGADGGWASADYPRMTFEVVNIDCYPTDLVGAVQHNAWWDAMALRHAYRRTGKLVLIDDGAVERVARAIDHELVWEIETDVLAASLTREEQIKVARAALSALGVK